MGTHQIDHPRETFIWRGNLGFCFGQFADMEGEGLELYSCQPPGGDLGVLALGVYLRGGMWPHFEENNNKQVFYSDLMRCVPNVWNSIGDAVEVT